MQPIWKPLAIASMATVALLLGLTFWSSFRENPMTARMRRNLEEQIRYHLGQAEPQKAAAILDSSDGELLDPGVENALRLETARKSTPEAGAKVLDGLHLAAMDRGQAAEAAQTRVDLQRQVFEWNVLESGALPAPFEPQAFSGSKKVVDAAQLSQVTAKLLALIAERRDLAKRHDAPADPALGRLESLAVAVRYALGEIPFEQVKLDDPETRVRFGDLLYRERQFERALEVWKPVADDKRVIRRVAELAILRRLAPKTLRLWNYDLDPLLGRNPIVEAEVTESLRALFQEARPGEIERPRDVFERKGIPRDDAVFVPDAPEMIVSEPPGRPNAADGTLNAHQLYLLVEHQLFDFKTTFDRPFMTRADPQFRLHSAYTGPIRFRLFKVKDLQTLMALDAETLPARRSELQPVREWEKQFTPLSPTGRARPTGWSRCPRAAPGFSCSWPTPATAPSMPSRATS
jgi:hypothetical protein